MQEINAMTRMEKLEYLLETCSPEFIKACPFLDELVRWMDEDDFSKFFTYVSSCWDIKSPEELEDAMNA